VVKTRPAYAPISVQCPQCGAPLTVPDERAQLVVCAHCDARSELTGPRRDALDLLTDQRSGRSRGFDLPIGEEIRHDGARYEVIARLLWGEFDDEGAYYTRVYALYNPRRPLLYLDEYEGSWGLTSKVHAMPTTSTTNIHSGTSFETADGERWRCTESVRRQLVYVDGCLPWVASVGDNVMAWECSGRGDARYEIELTGQEIEYNRGKGVTGQMDRMAPRLAELQLDRQIARQKVAARAVILIAIGLVGVLINGGIAGWAMFQGRTAHTSTILASQQKPDAFSTPFELTSGGLVRLDVRVAELDNSWAEVQLAVVQGDTVRHVTDTELSFYSGYDDGYWTEGSKEGSVLVSGLTPGTYSLMATTLVGMGESATPQPGTHLNVDLSVVDGARSGVPALVGALGCAFILLFGAFRFNTLRSSA